MLFSFQEQCYLLQSCMPGSSPILTLSAGIYAQTIQEAATEWHLS